MNPALLDLPGAGLDTPDFHLQPNWLDTAQADALCATLLDELPWAHEAIRMYGREMMQPRLTAYHGDPDTAYRYSGRWWKPHPWHPLLAELRDRLAAETGVPFNSVLANLYRDGNDAMGWHSDDETELGPAPVIASLSLGATRRFLLRPKQGGASRRLDLGAGSLLVMRGASQRDWQHSVPRTARTLGPRINLTFRRIRPSG